MTCEVEIYLNCGIPQPVETVLSDGFALSPKLEATRDLEGVVFIFGGGSTRGPAEVGVSEALRIIGVVPQVIIGNSAGSVAGVSQAMGMEGSIRVQNTIKYFRIGNLYEVQELGGMSDQIEGRRVLRPLSSEPTKMLMQDALYMMSKLKGQAGWITFEDLPIPMLVMMTDAVNQKLCFAYGSCSVAEAIQASVTRYIARPVKIDNGGNGGWFADGVRMPGGNFPVELARRLFPNKVIIGIRIDPKHDDGLGNADMENKTIIISPYGDNGNSRRILKMAHDNWVFDSRRRIEEGYRSVMNLELLGQLQMVGVLNISPGRAMEDLQRALPALFEGKPLERPIREP